MIFLKLVIAALLVILTVILGYFNMTITWGLEVQSWYSFFTFLVLIVGTQSLMQIALSIKE
jgi:hypothetical protein